MFVPPLKLSFNPHYTLYNYRVCKAKFPKHKYLISFAGLAVCAQFLTPEWPKCVGHNSQIQAVLPSGSSAWYILMGCASLSSALPARVCKCLPWLIINTRSPELSKQFGTAWRMRNVLQIVLRPHRHICSSSQGVLPMGVECLVMAY